MKVCRTCKEEKPEDGFSFHSPGKLSNECRVCKSERSIKWARNNRERKRESQKRHRLLYGRSDYKPKPPRVIECRLCGIVFLARGGRQFFCCPEHEYLFNAHKHKPERKCVMCGKSIPRTTRIEAVTCGAVCRVRKWQLEHPEKHRQQAAQNASRRRARKRGLPEEQIDRLAIYDRDKGRCYICGKKVSRKNFDLDHIIAIVDGGGTVATNLAATHPSCNRKKHTKAVQAQLMLVG